MSPSAPESIEAPQTGVPACAQGGEILHVFPSRWAAAAEILRLAEHAAAVDVLALRGSEIVGLNDPLLRAGLATGGQEIHVRVLLLDPGSDAACRRADQLGEHSGSFADAIRLAETRLAELATRAPGLRLEIHHYGTLPIWRMIIIDGVQYVSTLCAGWEGSESVVYKLAETPHGALYQGFHQEFESFLANARRVI